MGLSMHYSGRIRSLDLIEDLVFETEDICKSLGWSTQCIKDEDLDGIIFAPEGCEPLFLTFLKDGHLCSPVMIEHKKIYQEEWQNKEFSIHTKTQYAGPDAHMAIIKLLKYLKGKYFEKFEMSDEGNYWETDDKQVLLAQFARFEFVLNAFANALENMENIPGESATSLADRIEKMLKEKGNWKE